MTAAAERRALRLSIADGALYALMVGMAETSFALDAVRLGSTAWQQGLVVGLPLALGSVGPLLMLAALRVFRRRRPLVVACTTGQALLLFGLPFVDGFGKQAPVALIAGVTLYQVFGQAAGTAWSSWYGDLVPPGLRARYFALRTRIIHALTLAGVLVAGKALFDLEPRGEESFGAHVGGAGFRFVFWSAAAARVLSTILLAVSPEPRFRGLPAPRNIARFLRTHRGTNAWRLVLAASALNLLVYVSSPYFAPFMKRPEGLGLGYDQYMWCQVALMALKVAFLGAWGRAIDRYGARPVFTLSAVLVSLVPLPWLFVDGFGGAVAAHVYSGFCWGGYELSLFAMMLGVTYKKTRPLVFAAHSMLNGSAQLGGTQLGAGILALAGPTAWRWTFAASLVGRVVAGLFVKRLLPVRGEEPSIGRGQLLLRVIGVRPHGGLSHRPMVEEHDPAPGERRDPEA